MAEWRDVVGYEGLYKVSDEGTVRNVRRGKVLNTWLDKDGYVSIILSKLGMQYNYKVHRIVATAFLPNSDNLPVVNHDDEVKTNNNVSNLEWMTVQDNNRHSAKLSVSVVQGIMFDRYYGLTVTAIAKRLGFNRKTICDVCHGRTWASVTGIQRS